MLFLVYMCLLPLFFFKSEDGIRDWRVTVFLYFFFSSRRRHTRLQGDWSSDVCSSDLEKATCLRDAPYLVGDVHGEPDRPSLLRECTRYRLLDPPRRVRGELEAHPVEIGRASCRERV